jgi:hypothetical protein
MISTVHINTVRLTTFAAASLFAVVAATAQTGKPKTWTCSAPNLVNFSYDGGDSAYIHLTPYASGGTYPVTKTKAGTQATGVTANGTKFVCTAS